MELRLCIVVELFCSPVRNIGPLISLRDLPYRGTMSKCLRQVSQNKVVFSVAPVKILDSHIFRKLSLTYSLSATQINMVME